MGNHHHHHHHHDLRFSLSNYGGFREKVQGVGSWNQVPTLLNLLLSPNTTMTQVMGDGITLQSGKYKDLLESGTDFGALVAAQDTSMELVEQSTNVNDDSEPHESPKSQNLPSPRPKEANGENGFGDQPKSQKGTSKLIKDEEREKGQVSLQVYKTYSTEVYGWWGVIAVLSISLLWQGPLMAGDYWLAYENGDDHASSFNPSFCIRIYAIIPAVSCVLVMAKLYLPHVGLKTAQLFFEQIIYSILHAPMSFFYTTPSGRVLSRASTNQTNIDLFLPFFITLKVAMYIMVLSIGIIICQVAWLIILIIIPLAWFNIWYRGYYLATSRELTHLDSITKAPVIHHFSESVSGVMTIRCFRKVARFYQENIDRVNANMCMDFRNNGSNEWLGFRLELFGSFVLCLAAVFMVLLPSNVIKPGIYST